MFGVWAVQFTGVLPIKIFDSFKKGIELKTATQSVRVSYLQWLLACLRNSKLPPGTNLIPSLLKTVEKAAQNSTQIPLVTEAVCAACILLLTEDISNSEAQHFWNVVLDMEKPIFLAERFISATPTDTLCYIMLMCEKLLLNYSDRIKGSADPIYKAVVYCMNSNVKKVRNYCLPFAENIVSGKNGIIHAKALLKETTSLIQTAKVSAEGENSDENTIPAKAFIDSILVLCCGKNMDSVNSQCLALCSLLCSHHPAIVSDLWENVLKNLNLDPKSLISLNSNKIKEIILLEYKSVPMYENSVATLTKLCPEVVFPILINFITEQLNNPEMSQVTDTEYFTFLTPDGELYDKSVIPNADDIFNQTGMKRENKVYTYKEQLEELQLRREIEEKRRREGKSKPPQFTPKQKEAIKNQTDKESAIKQTLKCLNDKILVLISLIEGASRGNPDQLSLWYSSLLPCILRVFSSPLAAPPLTKMYYNIKTTCFRNNLKELGELISIATIRLYEPHCDLNESWEEENLNEIIKTIISKISDLSLRKTTENDEIDENLLTAPAFCYVFEFLKKALLSKSVSKDETLLLAGIQIMGKHAQQRGSSIKGELTDYRHPKYMPRFEMMKLLMNLISIHRGRIQTQAVAALLDVAGSSSGHDYCAKADKQEIDHLLIALQNNLESVRDVSLRALMAIVDSLPSLKEDYELGLRLTRRLFVAKHDISDDNKVLADTLWMDLKLEVPIVMGDELMKDVIHPELCIQKAAASALVSILKEDTSMLPDILDRLLEIYDDKLTMIPAKMDQFGREIESAIDPWGPRRGVAIALCQIAQFFTSENVNMVTQFMVAKGLGDREEIVHKEMLAAALSIVDLHGKDTVAQLLPVFEDFLDKAPVSSKFDNIRQAVVILMGSLARHLDKTDPRIKPIVQRLLTALSTPSQQVQEAVANCIPYLMPSVKDDAPQMVKKLLSLLVKSDKYGERRGAAYGIAGVVKGLGILSLKQLDIMTKLTNYIQDKKNFKQREGALFAFEMLCHTLGRLFEPYIVHVLPHLLQCFGDSSQYVRQAADDTAKVVMAKLSAHGVKLVLPSLLHALDEDSWRTKTASVELLGAMGEFSFSSKFLFLMHHYRIVCR